MSKIKAGFIGYRNFAGKLRKLFEATGMVGSFLFYHPNKLIEGYSFTNNLEDIYDCDFIVIASPDSTHGEYLRLLQEYDGYVFCEKIPVMNRDDLQYLKRRMNNKVYFDFNYRKSLLYDELRENLDDMLYINIRCGVGLALNESYADNWRSKKKKAPLGVFQLTGIHFFDLLVFCLGRPEVNYTRTRNLSPYGNSIDNFNMGLEFGNGMIADLYFSYTSPYYYDIRMVTKNKLLEFNEDSFSIRGPREVYDKDGLFVPPPLINHKKINLYGDSLKRSVDYFLGIVRSNGEFKEGADRNNLLSNELFVDIMEKCNEP